MSQQGIGQGFDFSQLDQASMQEFMGLKNSFDFALQSSGAQQLDPFMQALMQMTGLDQAESQQSEQYAQNGQPQQTLNDFTQQMMSADYQAMWG